MADEGARPGAQMVRHQFMLPLVPGRPAVSLAQHERIVAAIVARNPDEAEAAMRDHITSVLESLNSLPPSKAVVDSPVVDSEVEDSEVEVPG